MTEFRKITSHPSYEISEHGIIRRVDTKRQKSAVIGKNGYWVVNLWHANKGKVCYVHRLLAAAFIGEPKQGATVNHIDGDRLNNALYNLEYLSNSDNAKDMWRRGRGCSGARNGHAKISSEQAVEIYKRANRGERTSDLAREFGLRPPIVSQIKNGTRWVHDIAAANLSS